MSLKDELNARVRKYRLKNPAPSPEEIDAEAKACAAMTHHSYAGDVRLLMINLAILKNKHYTSHFTELDKVSLDNSGGTLLYLKISC